MPKSKANAPTVLPDDANALSVQFYISDAASGNVPRVSFTYPQGAHFDHAISEYTTVTPAQKTALRAILLALRDETFTLEGYT